MGVNASSQSGWNGPCHSTSLELLGESLNKAWGYTQWEGSIQLRPSPLKQPFPSRHLSRLSHRKVPLAAGKGKRRGWQVWYSCPSAAKEQLKREPGSFPTQTTFIGVAPMLLGLLSIKSSTEIGTLHRKGRDPPQNTKCQETFVTQDEETHTATAVQNVPARKITGKQHGWFTPSSRARTTQNPQSLCCKPSQRGQKPND